MLLMDAVQSMLVILAQYPILTWLAIGHFGAIFHDKTAPNAFDYQYLSEK